MTGEFENFSKTIMSEDKEDKDDDLAWYLNYCKHYHRAPGMPKRETCKAGMVYDDVANVEELGRRGSGLRLPCLKSHHDPAERGEQPLCECPKLEWTTVEEAQARKDATDLALTRMEATFPLMEKLKKEHKGKDWSGVMTCPVCDGGELSVAHAGCNGHTRGRCSEEDCVNWIE